MLTEHTRVTMTSRCRARDQRAQGRSQPPQRARQHRAENRRRQGARGAECAPPRLEPAGALRSLPGGRDRRPGARDRRRRCRGGTARARIADRRRPDRCRAGAARAPRHLSAGAARARRDRPARGDRPLRGARAVAAQARDARLRRCADRPARHAGRHFGQTKPVREIAHRVVQAHGSVDLPVAGSGDRIDPLAHSPDHDRPTHAGAGRGIGKAILRTGKARSGDAEPRAQRRSRCCALYDGFVGQFAGTKPTGEKGQGSHSRRGRANTQLGRALLEEKGAQ